MKNLPRVDLHSIFIHLIPFLLLSSLVDRTLCAPALEGDDVEGGCYYMFNHYGEGDRILTNEPCLNCTCHNSMLMCYLRVCPFTKPIGQDCTIEKKPDQCCPTIICPEVPVSLVTPSALISSTTPATTTSLATITDSTELAHLERGCKIERKFYSDGAQVEGDPTKPCELCYCIRNSTACVMQECILHVEGCEPIFQDGVCCPVRYKCDYPPQITDETTTVSGLITTTFKSIFTSTPVPGGCVRNGESFADGSQIPGAGPCEHCYCMRGEAVCAVQECGAPLENAGGNCTAIAPPPGMCCPEKYSCDGDIVEESVTTVGPSDDEEIIGVTQPESSAASTEASLVSEDIISEKVGSTSAPEIEQATNVPSSSSENVVASEDVSQAPETSTSEILSDQPTATQVSNEAEETAAEGTTQVSVQSDAAAQLPSDSEAQPDKEEQKIISTERPEVPTTSSSVGGVDDTVSPGDAAHDAVVDSNEEPLEDGVVATTQSNLPQSEASTESENLITSSTDNILTQLLTSSPKPLDNEKSATETSSLEASSEKPEVTTLSSSSESDESSATSAPSSEASASSSTESSETSTEAAVETGAGSSEGSQISSTDKPTDVSGIDQSPQQVVEQGATEFPVTDSSVPAEEIGIKDEAEVADEVSPTAKPVANQGISLEVTTIRAEAGEEEVPSSDSQPSPSGESVKETEFQTTQPPPAEDKISESTEKLPIEETDSITPSTISDAEQPKEPETVSVTTVRAPVDSSGEEAASPTTVSPAQDDKSGSTESSPAHPIEIPADTSSSTVETATEKMEDKVSTSTAEIGEVVGEMHASSTPEPAESLSMHSSTTEVPIGQEDENEIGDSHDKISSDDASASSAPENTTSAPTSETSASESPVTTQQPSVEAEVEKEGVTESGVAQAVEKATEQPQPVVAPGEQLDDDKETESTVTTTAPVSVEPSEASPTEAVAVESSSSETVPAVPVESESTTIVPEMPSEPENPVSVSSSDVSEPEKTTQTPVEPEMVSDAQENEDTEEKMNDSTTKSPTLVEEEEKVTTADVAKPDQASSTEIPIQSSTASSQPDSQVGESENQTTRGPFAVNPDAEVNTTQTPSEDSTVPISAVAIENPEAQVTEQPESSAGQSDSSSSTTLSPETSSSAEAAPTTVAPAQEDVEAQTERDQPSQPQDGSKVVEPAEEESVPATSQSPSDLTIADEAETTQAPPPADEINEKIQSITSSPVAPEESVVPTTTRPVDVSVEDIGSTVQPPVSPDVSDMKEGVLASETPATTQTPGEEGVTQAPPVSGVETPEETPIKIEEDGKSTSPSTPVDETSAETQPPTSVVPEVESSSVDSDSSITTEGPQASKPSETGEDEEPVKDEAATTVEPPIEQPADSVSEAGSKPETLTTISSISDVEATTTRPVKDMEEKVAELGKEPEDVGTTVAPGIIKDEEQKAMDAESEKEQDGIVSTSSPETIKEPEVATTISDLVKESEEKFTTISPESSKEQGVTTVPETEKMTTITPESVKETVTLVPESMKEQEEAAGASDSMKDEEEKVTSPSTSTESSEKEPEEITTVPSVVQPEEKIGTGASLATAKPVEVPEESAKPVEGSEDIGVTVQPSSSPEVSDMKDIFTTTEAVLADGVSEEEDEASGVPGEGNCYVEGKTYRNGSSIPPTTPCHIVCACQNSIVHCLLVHCNPPPSDIGDCKPIYKQGVCCPTYDCEDSRVPSVTVTPGPIITNETVVTVTPETPSVETSESSEEPHPQPIGEGEATAVTPVSSSSESSTSSGVSSSQEEGSDDEISKPSSNDTIEAASPGSLTTTAASLSVGDTASSETPIQVDEPEASVVGTGESSSVVVASSETPSEVEPSSSPVPVVEDVLGEHHLEEQDHNITSAEVSSPPGSLYPVTTTTTVTPSSAPWPYPSSTPSPAMMTAGACLFDERVYMSAQQIPRDDPCDFCFCFRGDIICLQQSCPPPIPGCYEEPIPGFCCPRYECPVGNGNVTTQPPLFPPSYYHNQILNGVASAGANSGAIVPSVPSGPGCEVQGEYYESGQIITSTSGPCLECRCGSTGMMECDPRECQPEPMLRKMIAAITSR